MEMTSQRFVMMMMMMMMILVYGQVPLIHPDDVDIVENVVDTDWMDEMKQWH
jgi:hypothetical protein